MSADVVDGDDIGMIQRAAGARLLFEAAQPVGILGEGAQQDFDRHLAPEPRVPRAIHLPHASRAQHGDDFVGTKVRPRGESHKALLALFEFLPGVEVLAPKEALGLLVRPQQLLHLPKQFRVAPASLLKIGPAGARLAVQGRCKQLPDLLESLRRHGGAAPVRD